MMWNNIAFLGTHNLSSKAGPDNKSEIGQGILEYALIFVFVAVLLVVLLYYFGDRVEAIYQSILTALPF